MTGSQEGLALRWLTTSEAVDDELSANLLVCWREVSNAGGAVGFPFLPVGDEHVRPAVDAMVQSLDPALNRLLIATDGATLAGWLLLAGNASKLTRHWATLLRVQTALNYRGTGVGRALMTEAARAARDDFGLQQLHLELRGGLGLEAFYESFGWEQVGRWPGALALNEHDHRDAILMFQSLQRGSAPRREGAG